MSQTYAPGDTITASFPLSSATGAAVNADSTPTLLLYQNGTVTGVSVSSANPSTGRYTFSATIPGNYAARDEIRIEATATVGGIVLPATTVFRCRLDAAVNSRSSHSASDVWSVGTRALTDKADFTLTSDYDPAKTASQAGDQMALTGSERTTLAGVFWAVATSALTTVGSIGKLLVDNINATIGSRMASFTYTAPPSVNEISDRVERSGGPLALTQTSATSADGKLTTNFTNMVTRFLTMIESYSGGTLWRFITGALSQSSGGGGSSGEMLVALPLRLVIPIGEGCDGCATQSLTLNRGHIGPVRLDLVDATGIPVPTTSTTLTAKIVTTAYGDIVDLDDPTEVYAAEGSLTVQIDTTAAELVGKRKVLVMVTRDNGTSDVTSGVIALEIVG